MLFLATIRHRLRVQENKRPMLLLTLVLVLLINHIYITYHHYHGIKVILFLTNEPSKNFIYYRSWLRPSLHIDLSLHVYGVFLQFNIKSKANIKIVTKYVIVIYLSLIYWRIYWIIIYYLFYVQQIEYTQRAIAAYWCCFTIAIVWH